MGLIAKCREELISPKIRVRSGLCEIYTTDLNVDYVAFLKHCIHKYD
jgi:hypothetical protein